MSSVPKYPTASVSFTERLTPYVNQRIQECFVSCTNNNTEIGCAKLCTDWTVFWIGERHDKIINKYGNVL